MTDTELSEKFIPVISEYFFDLGMKIKTGNPKEQVSPARELSEILARHVKRMIAVSEVKARIKTIEECRIDYWDEKAKGLKQEGFVIGAKSAIKAFNEWCDKEITKSTSELREMERE